MLKKDMNIIKVYVNKFSLFKIKIIYKKAQIKSLNYLCFFNKKIRRSDYGSPKE